MTTMLVFLRCVRVGGGVCGCVCVCGSGMLICFVSALGSHEMERHILPIIIIIIISYKDHATNKEFRAKIKQAIGPH